MTLQGCELRGQELQPMSLVAGMRGSLSTVVKVPRAQESPKRSERKLKGMREGGQS